MPVIGADTSQLRSLAEMMGGRAGQIASARSVIDFRLRTIPWQGANANRFRSQWVGLRRKLQQTEAGLREGSRLLRAHAAEQDRASAAGGLGAIARIPRISLDGGKRDATREELLDDYADRNTQVHREIRSALEELRRQRDLLLPLASLGAGPMLDLFFLNNQIGYLEGLLEPSAATGQPRQYLVFEPRVGEQRLVEVVGDLSEADQVIFQVPGIYTDLGEYAEGGHEAATNLYRESNRLSDQNVAVISFMDYDVPNSPFEVAFSGGDSGVEPLLGLVAELHQMGFETDQLSIVAHSFGSKVVGRAMQAGLDVGRVIVVGSPGMGANDRAGLGSPEVELWAARAPNDPVGAVPHLLEIPASPALIPTAAVSNLLDLSVHGADPTDPDFGARPFPVPGATGHSAYTESKSPSLNIIAGLAIGDKPLRR